MANKQPDLFAELEEIVECGVCLERCRNPRSMQCLHTFCLHCIQQLIEKSAQRGRFYCPSCRAQVQVPLEGPEAFPSAFIWNTLTETVDRFKALGLSKKPQCTICFQDGKHTTATNLCTDCEKCLCDECLWSHNKFLGNHNLLKCSNIKPEEISEILKNKRKKCQHHGEEIKLYCQDCKDLLCIVCSMLDHASHKKEEIEKVADAHRAELDDMHDRMSKRVDHYDECLQKVDKELDNRNSQMQSKIQMLEHHEEKLVQKVKQSMIELKCELRDKTARSVKQLSSLKQTLNDEKSCLIDCKKKIKTSIMHGNKSGIITTNVREKQSFDNLLQNLTADHQLPKLRLDLQLTEVSKITKQALTGAVNCKLEDEPLRVEEKVAGYTLTPSEKRMKKNVRLGYSFAQIEPREVSVSPRSTQCQMVKRTPKVEVKTWKADNISISECATDGSYIILHNAHPCPGIGYCSDGSWRLGRYIDGEERVHITLPDFTVWRNVECKLFAQYQTAAVGGSDGDIECEVDTWGTGDNIVTTLYNMHGDKMATHTQTTVYD